MNTELEKKLMDEFSVEFGVRDDGSLPPITESLVGFGCECNDGWFDLIHRGLTKIKEYNQQMVEDCDEYKIRISQIKEKYGLLIISVYNGTDEILDYLDDLETESSKVCEYCGTREDVFSTKGWLITICGKCAVNYNIKRP